MDLVIYVWPDDSWCFEQNYDMHKENNGAGEKKFMVPEDLDVEDILELIQLKSLPGMLPDIINISGVGPIPISKKDALVITFDEDTTDITMIEGKYIITGTSTVIESKKANSNVKK